MRRRESAITCEEATNVLTYPMRPLASPTAAAVPQSEGCDMFGNSIEQSKK